MIMIKKDVSGKTIAEKDFTKEELSAYILYTINGCSQTNIENEEPIFIGSYH